MKSDSRQRLFEMMGKLDPTFKPRLNENYNSFINEDRTVYNNLLQMFQENNLRPGSFIAIGYVNAVDIPKRVFPTNANEEYARKLLEAAQEHNLSEIEIKILKEFISDEIWAKTKAGEIMLKSKKEPKRYFDLDNRFSSIIQFNRYVLNYMDRPSLAKNFQKQRDAEIELRRKYGFGKDDDQYPEDDWRRKLDKSGRQQYRGTGIEPLVDPRDVNKSTTYKDKMGDFPLYGDTDAEGNPRTDPTTGNQRMTLRQNISSNLKKSDTDYFFVDEKGTLNPVSYKFVNFFSKYIKEVREKIASELQADEAQFNAELKEIGSKYFSTQFLSDRIAFVTATVEDDKTKEKKPVYFYNDKLDILEQFPVNTQQLQTHINKYMQDSFKTAKEVADTENSTGGNELDEVAPTVASAGRVTTNAKAPRQPVAGQKQTRQPGDVKRLGLVTQNNATVQKASSAINTAVEFPEAFRVWFQTLGYKPDNPAINISKVRREIEAVMKSMGYN